MFSEKEKLYHCNCIGEERTKLTLKISNDNFQTYDSIFIDTVGGYLDIVIKNETTYVLYKRKPLEDELYFKKIVL